MIEGLPPGAGITYVDDMIHESGPDPLHAVLEVSHHERQTQQSSAAQWWCAILQHMRKTATFRRRVLATSEAVAVDSAEREALEELLGEPVARSESARLDQLASLGALMVERAAKEKAYADLARCLGDESSPTYRQPAMGAPIEGEHEEDLEHLFLMLDS